MFEGTNKLTLSQAAMMKLVEDALNNRIYNKGENVSVVDMIYNGTDWTTTFVFEKKVEDDE